MGCRNVMASNTPAFNADSLRRSMVLPATVTQLNVQLQLLHHSGLRIVSLAAKANGKNPEVPDAAEETRPPAPLVIKAGFRSLGARTFVQRDPGEESPQL